MCGLVAIYSPGEEPPDVDAIHSMTAAIEHRGPDDYGFGFCGAKSSGVWRDSPPEAIPGAAVAFGHRRLAIIDLTEAGRQPMVTEDGRYWLVYNGEVYNYRELRTELVALGWSFRTDTDTEVLLKAYAQWGTDCFRRLNGMWALLVWDRVEQTLCACRDRLGIKPLFFHRVAKQWLFASEIKGLLAHPRARREPDAASVAGFLQNPYTWPSGGPTFFREIEELPAGCYMLCKQGHGSLRRYWELPSPETPLLTDESEATLRFDELFRDAVRLRLRSDVRVGTMLSGGIDSTSVVRTAAALRRSGDADSMSLGTAIQAFSASYPGHSIDESEKVEILCSELDLGLHWVYPMQTDALESLFVRSLHVLEGPFFNSVPLVSGLLMSQAKDAGVKVVLDGHGADELFAGYPDRYCGVHATDCLRGLRFARAASEIAALRRVRGLGWRHSMLGPMSRIVGRRRVGPSGNPSPAPWLRVDRQTSSEIVERGAFWWQVAGRNDLDRRLRYDLTVGLLPQWLHLEDRTSMATSIEARVPFIDYRIAEFAFSIDNSLKIRNGQTKYLLRRVMRSRLPPIIVEDQIKRPFPGPSAYLLDEPLRPLIERTALSSSSRLSQFVDPMHVRRALTEFWGGARDQAHFIWAMINVETWLRAYFP